MNSAGNVTRGVTEENVRNSARARIAKPAAGGFFSSPLFIAIAAVAVIAIVIWKPWSARSGDGGGGGECVTGMRVCVNRCLRGADELKTATTAADAAADAKKTTEIAKEIERLQALQKAEQASAAGKSADAVSEAASKSFRERATDFARRYGVEAVGGAFATVAGMLIVNSVFNKNDDKEGGAGDGTGAGDEEEGGGSIADKIKSVIIVLLVITVVIGIIYYSWKKRTDSSAGTNVTVQANFEPMPYNMPYYAPPLPLAICRSTGRR
eukprot:jgi/Mesvir1/29791/Mv19487-RA.1